LGSAAVSRPMSGCCFSRAMGSVPPSASSPD
jgi:hypothetical protein